MRLLFALAALGATTLMHSTALAQKRVLPFRDDPASFQSWLNGNATAWGNYIFMQTPAQTAFPKETKVTFLKLGECRHLDAPGNWVYSCKSGFCKREYSAWAKDVYC
jgi:hypothetical protein